MKRVQRYILGLIMLLGVLCQPYRGMAQGLTPLPSLTVEEVLRRYDAQKNIGTISYRGQMIIDQGRRTLVKEMVAVAEGSRRAFVEFVNPEDRGIRYLKIDKELWMYFPEEQETVKIAGHLLKEGMMGSDFSYEDALESETLLDKYDARLLGTEQVGERPAYVVELTAKVRNVSYEKQKLWIDGERFVPLKAEMYAKSGKLLKVSESLKVERVGNRWFVTELVMRDMLKKTAGTRFVMQNIQLDVKLPADQFSLRRLSR